MAPRDPIGLDLDVAEADFSVVPLQHQRARLPFPRAERATGDAVDDVLDDRLAVELHLDLAPMNSMSSVCHSPAGFVASSFGARRL